MLKNATFFGTLAGLGFLLGAISGALALACGTAALAAETNMDGMNQQTASQSNQFQRIEQPPGNKIAVTLGGLGLIGLELWWFLLSKPKSLKVTTEEGIQEVTVTVDGGYEPNRIVVQAGRPVRLNFDRKDPSNCLEEVRFPDFRIAQLLTLNQITPIEFTPDKPGRYEFVCGMNMFRGVVEVQAADAPTTAPPEPTSQPANSEVAPSSVEATVTPEGIQEATIAVERGYQPKRVIVEARQFMCGLKMNRGVIEVRPSQPTHAINKYPVLTVSSGW